MFGTLARMRVKQGMGSAVNDLSKKSDPQEFWISVVFRDEASYRRNAVDPVQNQWFRDLTKMLESEPEWHDGKVAHSAHTH